MGPFRGPSTWVPDPHREKHMVPRPMLKQRWSCHFNSITWLHFLWRHCHPHRVQGKNQRIRQTWHCSFCVFLSPKYSCSSCYARSSQVPSHKGISPPSSSLLMCRELWAMVHHLTIQFIWDFFSWSGPQIKRQIEIVKRVCWGMAPFYCWAPFNLAYNPSFLAAIDSTPWRQFSVPLLGHTWSEVEACAFRMYIWGKQNNFPGTFNVNK